MPTVTLVPTISGPYAVGQVIGIQIVTSPDFPLTFGFQSNLAYDADVLSLIGVDFLPDFDTQFAAEEPADASGEITVGPILGGTSGAETAVGSYIAATLQFAVQSTDALTIELLPFNGELFNAPGTQPNPIVLDGPVTLDLDLNTGPEAVNDSASVPEGGSVEVDVLANDSDPDTDDTLTIDSFSDGANGTVTQTAGGLTYTPNTNFSGNDSFTYNIGDGSGGSDTATVDVTVQPAGSLPTATLVPTTTGPYAVGETIEVEIRASNMPALLGFQASLGYDADVLSLIGVDFLPDFDTQFAADEPAGASGDITVGPIVGGNGEGPAPQGDFVAATLEFQVQSLAPITIELLPFDGRLFVDDNDVNVILGGGPVTLDLDLNSAPDAVDDNVNVQEDGSVEVDVLFNDSDPDSDTLTIDSFTDGANGTVTQTAGGLTYTPNANFNGIDAFTYEVSDGNGGFDTASVSVTVDAVNDDPTGSVLITGTAEEDQTLTADASGIADADGLDTFSYQWFAGGTEIAGANGDTLVLGQPEVGAEITVAVSYTDGGGTPETVVSAATAPVVNVNDDPTGAVVIVGTPEEGQTLTADTSGLDDEDGLGAFSYQWFAGGTEIAGATGETFVPTQDEVGAELTVEVSYTDLQGTPESVISAASAPVANVNDDPTGAVLITGTAEEDQTLTADASGIADADGLDTFSYQWFAGGTEIAGANGDTLVLGQPEVGAEITVAVSYTDGGGTPETVVSAATAPVVNVNDDPTGAVVIVGTPEEGQTLTADTSGLDDEDGLGAFSYQWFAGGTEIAGATGETFVPTQDEVGAELTVEVSYTDLQGTPESVISAASAPVANVNDDPTGAVLITGTAEEDQTLTADASGIADADGLDTFSYQWFAGGTEIAGANGDTLVLGQPEVGAEITVAVSYTDGGGTPETVVSAATAPVVNVNDDPTGAVVIVGTPEEGQTLTADTSGLDDEDGLGAFNYQWFAGGTEIAGATGETFVPTQDEVGAELTVEVSYTDLQGTPESVISAASAPVANVNDDPTGAVLITGTAEEDQTLTADASGIADADGLDTFSYQWFAGGTEIAGANGDTLVLGQPEVGAEITVAVSYTDGGGTPETVVSAATAPVVNVNDDPTGAVVIVGTPEEGQTLTADTSGLDDEDGLGAFNYQWFAGGTEIAGATGETFVPTQDEVGAELTVEVSYTDLQGTPESVISAASTPVADSNVPPIAEDDNATVAEDDSVTIDVLVNDTDPDGGAPTPDEVLYRVNVGGPAVPVGDDDSVNPSDPDLDWGADTGNFGTTGNSPYLFANSGSGSTFDSSNSSSHSGLASATNPSIPAGTPADIFQTERYDLDSAPEMQWKFPVQADFGLVAGDEVIVRLYFAELFDQINAAGERVFDVSVEGAVPAAFDDIDPFDIAGANAGFMLDTVATIDADGTLDLEFIHGIENPALKGIEILQAGGPTAGNENLTVAIDTGPTNGSVVVNSDGTITYTPFADYNGSDSFIYEITDADGATDTATVDVTVDPVNDAPVLTVADEFEFLDSASGLVFTASATDVDVGDTLTFSLGGSDAGFFEIDPTTGAVSLSATTPPVFTIANQDIGSIADVTQAFDLTVGVSDGAETVDRAVTVNYLKDTDEDGVADASDNALFVANPDQRDTDGDGYGNIIDADLDNDGQVLLSDLFLFREAFGNIGLTDGVDVEANADFTGDGAVTSADIAIFRDLFGESIEPQSLIGDDYISFV